MFDAVAPIVVKGVESEATANAEAPDADGRLNETTSPKSEEAAAASRFKGAASPKLTPESSSASPEEQLTRTGAAPRFRPQSNETMSGRSDRAIGSRNEAQKHEA